MRYRPCPEPIETLRVRLLRAALPHVPFDGWSAAALLAGARDLGLPAADVERAFPQGPGEAIELHSHLADLDMLAIIAASDSAELRLRERVAAAVRARLEPLAPDREAVRRAVAFMAFPTEAARATRMLARTVDAIWQAAGDRSADFSWYTKRALLAGVYGTTLLHWLDDRSEGAALTWAFLDRRIADVMRIPSVQADIARRARQIGRRFLPGGRRLRARP